MLCVFEFKQNISYLKTDFDRIIEGYWYEREKKSYKKNIILCSKLLLMALKSKTLKVTE